MSTDSIVFSKPTIPVTINVGGTIFQTTTETISRCDFLAKIVKYTDGTPFIDRNPKYFGDILDHLRYGASIPIEAQPEIEFYCIDGVTYKETLMDKLADTLDSIENVLENLDSTLGDIDKKLDNTTRLLNKTEGHLSAANIKNRIESNVSCDVCWNTVFARDICQISIKTTQQLVCSKCCNCTIHEK